MAHCIHLSDEEMERMRSINKEERFVRMSIPQMEKLLDIYKVTD